MKRQIKSGGDRAAGRSRRFGGKRTRQTSHDPLVCALTRDRLWRTGDACALPARLCRAHANCYENLPAFAAISCVAALSGNAQIIEPLALWALAARVGQSTVHLISTRNLAVMLRFGLLMVQWVMQVYWIAKMLSILGL